jgi:hypothetical protein
MKDPVITPSGITYPFCIDFTIDVVEVVTVGVIIEEAKASLGGYSKSKAWLDFVRGAHLP